MLCGSRIRLSCWQRKRSRLLPRPSKRLTQLGSPACLGKNVYFSAAATSKGGKDGDEPRALPACRDGAPGPASPPAAWLGVRGGQQPLPWRGVPAARVPGPGRPLRSHRSSWSRGKAETGRLHTGRLRQPGWGRALHQRARAPAVRAHCRWRSVGRSVTGLRGQP